MTCPKCGDLYFWTIFGYGMGPPDATGMWTMMPMTHYVCKCGHRWDDRDD